MLLIVFIKPIFLTMKKTLAISIIFSACAALFITGCSDSNNNGTQNQQTNSSTNVLTKQKNKKDDVFIVGTDPENIKTQKIGETILTDWNSPDNSFSVKLPSAARCTQRTDGVTSMIILCMAASRDVLSMITYTYFEQGETGSSENKLKVLEAMASRKLVNDKTAPKVDNTIVAELTAHKINDTQVVKATNASGQSVFKSATFFKGPFLIHIVSTPNKNSPKGIDFVKAIIDSVVPTKGEHQLLNNNQDSSINEQLKALMDNPDSSKETKDVPK